MEQTRDLSSPLRRGCYLPLRRNETPTIPNTIVVIDKIIQIFFNNTTITKREGNTHLASIT